MKKLAPAYFLAAVGIVGAGLARFNVARLARFPLAGFFITAAFAAFWLSLGPQPGLFGTGSTVSLYTLMSSFWPGMDAIRVSSRYAALFLIFFAVLAGMGAAYVERVGRSLGRVIVLMLAVALIVANMRRPFPINQELQPIYLNRPAAYLRPAPQPPLVYRYLASLPESVVIAELPFDDLWYNTRYLYFSTFHWHRMVNGFTSFYPPAAQDRQRWLINPLRTPEESWLTLRNAGATHVVLHSDAWDAETARALMEYFEKRGAKLHGRFDGAVVYPSCRGEKKNRTIDGNRTAIAGKNSNEAATGATGLERFSRQKNRLRSLDRSLRDGCEFGADV